MSDYGLDVLTVADCRRLLGTQRIGRVGVCSGRPGVFPVLYGLLDGDVVFRTAPGEKLIAAALFREVVFEVDSFNEVDCTGWSVNVVGPAEEITLPGEIARADVLDLDSWAGEVRDRYVRVRSAEVTGRRISATG